MMTLRPHYLCRELRRLAKDRQGQDFVEYALMLAFVGTLAGIIITYDYAPSLSAIWARVNGVLHTIGGA